MMQVPENESKQSLDGLLSQICEGEPDAAVYEQLNAILRDDPAARQKYLDCLLVHGILQWDHIGAGATLAAISGDKPPANGNTNRPVSPSANARATASSSPLLGFLGSVLPGGLSGLTQGHFSLGTLLAVALISSVLTLAAAKWHASPNAAPQAVAPVQQPAIAAQPTEYVATLVSASDVRWVGGERPVAQGDRLPAAEVRLTEGVMEIMFDSGVKAILEGPAWFVPQSNRSGLLRQGRLVVHAPQGAQPFVVQTPMTAVLGSDTEFAVEVTASEATKLHVYSGGVEVSGRNHSSSTGVTRTHVSAGEGLLVEAAADAKLIPLAPEGNVFVRSLPDRRRQFPAGLVSYWNFDEQGGPAFDLRGQNHGLLQGISRTSGLVGKGAVEFTNQRGQQVNVGSGDDTLKFSSGIAVEALFVSRWDGKLVNYDEIYRKDDGNQRVLLALQYDHQGNHIEPRPAPARQVLAFGLNVGGIYSEMELYLDGQEGRPTVADLTDGKMHHVVATYDAPTGVKSLYLDGVLRVSQQFTAETAIISGGEQLANIGNTLGGWEPFSGVIDEVALYSRALSAAEVAEHWRLAQHKQSYFDVPATAKGDDSI